MQSKTKSIITTVSVFFWFVLLPAGANAASKTETLKGVITLGIGGYGLKLPDGSVIRFMGHGGNTVFATCHNGEACEITGLVLRSTSTPLFASINKVRKLKGTIATQPGAAQAKPQETPARADNADNAAEQDTSPLLPDTPATQEPDATQAKPAATPAKTTQPTPPETTPPLDDKPVTTAPAATPSGPPTDSAVTRQTDSQDTSPLLPDTPPAK